MAECSSLSENTKERENEDETRICPASGTGRRPLSDSSIKYEENAFHEPSNVILVHYSERRNSLTPGNSDGDTSDEGQSPSNGSRTNQKSSFEHHKSFSRRQRNTAKCGYACDCQQSQKAKRKAASKLVNVSSVGFTVPVPSVMGDGGNHRTRKDSLSFINKVKRWFGDSGSPTHFEDSETRWPRTVGSSTSKLTKCGAELTSLTKKDSIHKKERRFLLPDILALTNCPYYWGKINRHEAEELLLGKSDGTFLLRDSAHKDHLFSVSFRRYNKTLHARIEQWDHKYSFDRESSTAYFSWTIESLLAHYSVGEYCMFFEPMLVKPLHRTQPQPLLSLCRGVIASHVQYEDVAELPIPASLKTYIYEYSYNVKPKSKKDESDGKRKRNSTLCLF